MENNKLQIFNNPEFGEIRTLEIDGEPWFVAKDVAVALGYVDPNKAIVMHVDEEDKLNDKTASSLGQRGGWFINESGVYGLVMSSKLKTAKQFKRWVKAEVLPSIRKHGAYITPKKIEEILTDPDTIINLCNQLKAERKKNEELQVANNQLAETNQVMKPKADYFDDLVYRENLSSIRDTAKELGVKEKVFIKYLLDNKYLYRSQSGRLKPYAAYTNDNNKLFVLKECNARNNGTWTGSQTLVTPQGKGTFRLLLHVDDAG